MTSTECTVGGRLSSYRLTTGAVWPSLLSNKKLIIGFQSRKTEYFVWWTDQPVRQVQLSVTGTMFSIQSIII